MDITGKRDAINIREKYQKTLDSAYSVIVSKVEFLYGMNHKLKWAMSEIFRLEKDTVVNIDEKSELIRELSSILERENLLIKEHLGMRLKQSENVTSITQKLRVSEMEDVNYQSMMDNFRYMPRTEIKSGIDYQRNKIVELQKNIAVAKRELNKNVSDAKREIAYFPRNFLEIRNDVAFYKNLLSEAYDKLDNMRYPRGVLYKIASETTKLKVDIDVINHKVDNLEYTVNRLEQEVIQAEMDIRNRGW